MNNVRGFHVAFREEQRFEQLWLRALVVGMFLLQVVLFGVPMIQRFIFGQEPGEGAMSDTALLLNGTLALAVTGSIVLLFALTNLATEVRPDGLYLRFFPFHLSFWKVPLEDVTRCRAVTYRPVRDYGGWGIKGGRRSRAYNVSGNRGVRIDYADGTHLLIGSQRPEELAAAIQDLLRDAL